MRCIGRYEIYEQLGKGAMGVVHRARDTVLDRFVALKTIRTTAEVIPDVRERFYREARACARLQHPNIVTVYDLGEADLTAFISMELLIGADLRKVIQNSAAIPLFTRIEVMAQICDALHHAHSHGVVHRDIKPSNIFLTDGNQAKVLDFGIARLQSSNLTVVGTIMGTPNYMAPEQILARRCDHTADLFSAAVVFFELIAGAHPFRSGNIPERIVKGQPDSLYEHLPSTPPVLEKIMARALSKNPEARYRSGAEFAADLRVVSDAMRLHGSTSGIVLPSEQMESATEALVPDAPVPSARRRRPPEGENTQEWALSEMLRLIPALEQAVARQDRLQAKELFKDIEEIALYDKRFGEAVQTCRRSLETLNPQPERLHASASASASETSPAPALVETILFPQSGGAAAPPVIPQGASRAPAKPTETQPEPAPGFSVARQSHPAGRSSRNQVLVIIAASLLFAVLVTTVYVFWSGPKLETPLATAKVKANGSKLRDRPEILGNVLGELRAGQEVRVIRELPSDASSWTQVQAVVNGKPTRPGFIKASELDNWRSQTPSNQAKLDSLFAPAIAPPPTPAAEPSETVRARTVPRGVVRDTGDSSQGDFRHYLASAENLLQMGRYTEALKDVDTALEYRPNSSDAKSLRDRIRKAQELERESH